jgi:hypothetical protein
MTASQSRLGDVRAQATACAGDKPDFIDCHGTSCIGRLSVFSVYFDNGARYNVR